MSNLHWKIIGGAISIIGSLLLIISSYIFNSLDNQKTQLLHIHTELNNYIRHFNENCQKNHNLSDNDLRIIKKDIRNIQSQLSLFPQIKTSK